jgi:hypothetical protein
MRIWIMSLLIEVINSHADHLTELESVGLQSATDILFIRNFCLAI